MALSAGSFSSQATRCHKSTYWRASNLLSTAIMDIDHNRQELSHSKDMPLSPPWIRHNRNVDKHWNTNKLQYAEKCGMHHTDTVKCCWCCHVFHFGNAVLLPNVFSSVHVLNQLTNYISTLKFAQIREPIWIEQYGNDCGRGDLCWQALHQVTHALQRPELGRMKNRKVVQKLKACIADQWVRPPSQTNQMNLSIRVHVSYPSRGTS